MDSIRSDDKISVEDFPTRQSERSRFRIAGDNFAVEKEFSRRAFTFTDRKTLEFVMQIASVTG
jgi:hypothetical protein